MRETKSRLDRGQLNFDLLIGVTVFVLALAFVFSAVSGMVTPYVHGQEHTLVADRVATLLADGSFATDQSSIVNATCAFGFFNASYLTDNGTGCRIGFPANSSSVHERVAIDRRYSVNVSLVRDTDGDGKRDVLCTDGEVLTDCPGDTRLTAGPTPPTNRGSVVSARRVVVLDGLDVVLEVRVW